jgi:DNA invertase Pin-like site-specific DNA recombinase
MTACGRLVFHIFASLAEFERTIIRKCTPGRAGHRSRPWLEGWPPASSDGTRFDKAMLVHPRLTAEGLARQLRVAPSTLHRHLPCGRSVLRVWWA